MLSPQTTLRQVGDTTILELAGDLTVASAPALEAAFQQACAAHLPQLLLTFRSKDYINSAGIALLIDLATQSRERGMEVRLVQPSAHFRKIFRLVGLMQHVGLFASVEEALEA